MADSAQSVIPTFKLVLGTYRTRYRSSRADCKLSNAFFLIDPTLGIRFRCVSILVSRARFGTVDMVIANSWRRWYWKDHFCEGEDLQL